MPFAEPRRALLALAVILASFPAPPGAAWAHAVLLDTEPAADSVVAEAPATITLTFNEPVQPVVLQILDDRGTARDGGIELRGTGNQLRIGLPEPLGQGGYLVSWRVISADSHPIGGSFRFTVGDAPAARGEDAAAAPATPHGWQATAIAARAAFLFTLLATAGGVWFLIWSRAAYRAAPAVEGGVLRRVMLLAVLALTFGPLLIPLQGALMLGAGSGIADAAALRAGGDSPLGRSVLVALAATLVLLAGMAARHRPVALAVAGVAALVAAASPALTGHAATAAPRLLTAPSLALHAIAVAFWLGALWPLLLVLRRAESAVAAASLRRFSSLATIVVGALVLAGTVLAAVQLESPRALVTTDFGRILLLKLGLVTIALGLAWQNRRALTPALAAGDTRAGHRLARNIRLEIAAIAGILLVTATLGHTPPPRTVAGTEAAPQAALARTIADGNRVVQLSLTPGRAGHNELILRFATADGAPLSPQTVILRLALPELGIEPLERELAPEADRAVLSGADFSLAGLWALRISALFGTFDRAVFETELPVR